MKKAHPHPVTPIWKSSPASLILSFTELLTGITEVQTYRCDVMASSGKVFVCVL